MSNTQKPWYKSKWGWLKGFLLLGFLPFVATYHIWTRKNLNQKQKIQYTVGTWVATFIIVAIFQLSPSPEPTPRIATNTVSENQVQQEPPKQTEQQQESIVEPVEPQTSLDKIYSIVEDKAGVIPDVFSGEDIADETNSPYNVVVNLPFDHSISSCFMAKSLSVDVVKALYMDETVRSDISRVIITIPYYLRMSLGANDGVPLAENKAFNGPTVTWNTFEELGLGEAETGRLETRTWGRYLDKCE